MSFHRVQQHARSNNALRSRVDHYLNKPEIRKILGVEPSFGNFSSISMEVNQAFEASLDEVFPTSYYVSALLERGVRVLLYVGANDWICNWVRIHCDIASLSVLTTR